MHVKIFLPNSDNAIKLNYQREENEYCVGVDKGALVGINNNITIDEACGDFDSVNDRNDLETIKSKVRVITEYNPVKDDPDTMLAVKRALELNPSKISIYSEFSGRFDHTYSLVHIAFYAYKHVSDMVVYGVKNKVSFLGEGVHEIIKSDYDYVSLFAWCNEVEGLTLKGFEYPLANYSLKFDNILCLSNAYISSKAQIKLSKGVLLCIESKDE